MTKASRIVVLTAAAAVLAAGTATAFAATGAGTGATPATAAVLTNGFERPAVGSAYPLSQWAADGWSAPWDTGLNARSLVDTSTKHSGAASLRVSYPQGMIGPQDSGVSAPFRLTPAREYHLSQWVRFSPDFSWGTTSFAGKVGVGLAGGASCSGGQECTGYNGFSSRFIWRTGGRAALYYYSMGHAGQYGDYADLERDGAAVFWPRGRWVNVVQRLRVNTVTNGEANPDGEIQVWFDGVTAAHVTGLRFVRNGDQVDRAYLSSFAGGATTEFAPRNDSYIWYDDLTVATNRADVCELSPGGCGAPPVTARPTTAAPPVTTAPAGAAWAAGAAYRTGQVVTHGGVRYECRQAHTSLPGWEPPNAAALWRRA